MIIHTSMMYDQTSDKYNQTSDYRSKYNQTSV